MVKILHFFKTYYPSTKGSNRSSFSSLQELPAMGVRPKCYIYLVPEALEIRPTLATLRIALG